MKIETHSHGNDKMLKTIYLFVDSEFRLFYIKALFLMYHFSGRLFENFDQIVIYLLTFYKSNLKVTYRIFTPLSLFLQMKKNQRPKH